MKKSTFKEKIGYRFDNLMSKGTVAMVGVLFLITAVVVVLAGALLAIVGRSEGTFGDNVWSSIMHIIDAGTITGAETHNFAFIIIMSLVTLCGLFVTSILIGIITTGFEGKLHNLRKGNSRIIESNHTVILGFNDSVYSLISETIEANANQKKGCIVILADEEKEVVETAINEVITDFKTTKVICRKGSITDFHMLKKCSLENARCVIINEDRDLITIKSILAVNNYLDDFKDNQNKPHLVATIYDKSNYQAAQIISEDNAEIVLVEDAISKIIAQTCRHPGLSDVLIELFDFDGDELYFENHPEITGSKFGDVLNYFEKAIVFGYKRNEEVYLNPDKDVVMEKDDEVLLLVEDDGVAKPVIKKYNSGKEFELNQVVKDEPVKLLIIGANDKTYNIINELDEYLCIGSTVTIANLEISDNIKELSNSLNRINLIYDIYDVCSRENLERLATKDVSHILLLSDDEDNETSDATTLLRLIHLRDIAKINNSKFSITSEMKDVANQKLAKVAQANDLVIGSNIINLMLTQIAENRSLSTVFQELLQAEGSEIYIRKAANYVKLNTEIDFYSVTNILKDRNEIAIGYKKQNGDSFEIITNPLKSDKIKFYEEDGIITLAVD